MQAIGYQLDLYIAGDTPKSREAVETLESLCATHLPDRHTINVIDVYADPELAEQAEILTTPTLVRRIPAPEVRVVGDLADESVVLAALDVHPPGG